MPLDLGSLPPQDGECEVWGRVPLDLVLVSETRYNFRDAINRSDITTRYVSVEKAKHARYRSGHALPSNQDVYVKELNMLVLSIRTTAITYSESRSARYCEFEVNLIHSIRANVRVERKAGALKSHAIKSSV